MLSPSELRIDDAESRQRAVLDSLEQLVERGQTLVLDDYQIPDDFPSRREVVLHVVGRILANEEEELVAEAPSLRQGTVAVRRKFVDVIDDATFGQHLK